MTKPSKADDFLQNMKLARPEPAPVVPPRQAEPKSRMPPPTRVGLRHFGGYLDMDTVEKAVVLRARLGLDNSELIKLAIEDLHKKHLAKRAFGDA
jgi:hypothetical protein